MVTRTITEYGAQYPAQLLPGSKFVTDGPKVREEAEGIVRYVNKRAEEAGISERALLVERTVTYSDWVPSNTGVVAPYQRERTEDAEQ